jgi:hypothetical protein
MSNTYTWTATNLIGYPQYEGETDVITTVFYNVVADDGQGHTASLQSIQQTPLDPAAPFIPYPDLTNDIVIGWVQNALGANGVTSIYANLDAQIEAQINPPQSPESFPLPWGSATGTVSDYVPPAPVVEIVPPLVEQAVPELVFSEPASSDSLTEAPVVIEPAAPDESAPAN